MWEVVKFFLCCIGFCCVVVTLAFAYMFYVGEPDYIGEEDEK